MDIVIVGAGNIAHCYGQLLKLHGHQIVQVMSRDAAHASRLGEVLNARWGTDLSDINMDADAYILAVSDAALPVLNDTLRLGKRIVAHTAGAASLSVIGKISTHTGVMYPLQSIRKELKSYPPIPVLLEASNEETLRRIQQLAQSIASRTEVVDSRQRLQLHLSAVLVNNFTNHLIALAKSYCEREGLDFSLLAPIMRETFERLEKHAPDQVQTGPALRHDEATMALHRDLLEQEPYLRLMYQVMSDSIQDFYARQRADV